MLMEKYNPIEHSIITKYKKTLFHRFVGAVKDYRLISPGDRIAVSSWIPAMLRQTDKE